MPGTYEFVVKMWTNFFCKFKLFQVLFYLMKNKRQQEIRRDVNIQKKNTKYIICFYWTILVLYLAIIYFFSSQNGAKSHEVSAGLLQYLKVLILFIPGNMLEFLSGVVKNYEYVLRKTAHFTEYLVLALIFYKAIVVSSAKTKNSLKITLIFCFLYAVSDEVHQIFVSGRAFAVKDIIIDTAGATLGVSTIYLTKFIKTRRREQMRNEEINKR